VTATTSPEAASAIAPRRRSPYQGLVPYTEADAAYFFGRDGWREVVTDHLLAYRLSLFYGASGVGKSSILRAGVAHHLRGEAAASVAATGATELAVVEFSAWQADPLAALKEKIAQSIGALSPKLAERPPTGSLADVLVEWSNRIVGREEDQTPEVEGLLLVILDQFEEYFVYNPTTDGRDSFAAEFADAVERTDVPVNFLVSIREDALDKLDRFDARITGVFDNLLRCRHLDWDAAEEAIRKPIEKWAELEREKVDVEGDLVDNVRDQVRAGRVRLGETGEGTLDAENEERFVEAPYLQLVMTRIWDEERSQGSNMLRAATLEKLGGAERIVQRHLDETMDALPRKDRHVAIRTFRYLVTPDQTKIALPASALSKWANRDKDDVERVLQKLAAGDRRILRVVPSQADGAPSYEIFHDRLAPGILDFVSRARLRRRRRLLAFGAAAVLAAILVGAAVPLGYLYHQNSQLKSTVAELRTPFLRGTLSAGQGPVVSAAFGPDGQRIVTAGQDQTVRLWRVSTQSQLAAAHLPAPLTGAAFSPNGRFILGTAEQPVLVDAKNGRRVLLRYSGSATSASFRPDSRQFVVAGRPTVLVDLPSLRTVTVAGHTRTASYSTGSTTVVGINGLGQVQVWPSGFLRFEAPQPHVVFPRQRGYLTAVLNNSPLPDEATTRFLILAGGTHGARIIALGGFDLVRHKLFHDRVVRVLDRGRTVSTALFSPDDGTVLTAGHGPIARLWSARTGGLIAKLRCRTGPVVAAFSPDSRLVATGGGDGVIRLWETRTGQAVRPPLRGHEGRIRSIAFSPDGRLLVSGSDDDTARIWTVPGRADLVVKRGTLNVVTGSQTRVEVTGVVVNKGVADAGPTTVVASVARSGRRPFLSLPTGVPGLGPGQQYPITVAFTLPRDFPVGRTRLALVVDPAHSVSEQSYRNNASRPVQFTVPRPNAATTVTTSLTTTTAPASATTVTIVSPQTVTVAAPPVTVTVTAGVSTTRP
jgi:WD40 repeat protein